jgi:hypothetical protein
MGILKDNPMVTSLVHMMAASLAHSNVIYWVRLMVIHLAHLMGTLKDHPMAGSLVCRKEAVMACMRATDLVRSTVRLNHRSSQPHN